MVPQSAGVDALTDAPVKKEALAGVSLFVLDLDGTVYLSDTLIDGALSFLEKVNQSPGRDFLFFSNNASRTAKDYLAKLRGMGIAVRDDQMMTAGDVCAQYLLTHEAGKTVYLNGTKALTADWEEKGVPLTKDHPDIVVQSFDLTMTYERMEKACTYIRNGARFFATHKDINCPVTAGFLPDCGAMCALITASTGVSPRFFGKPEKETLNMITERTGKALSEIAFAGDRIYTDVATGVLNGAKGLLVLSGESDMETVNTSKIKPTAVFSSLGEMAEYL